MGWEVELPDVVAGQPIESAWGNEIRDSIVHVIGTVAGLPTDIDDGSVAYVADRSGLYLRAGGVWRGLPGGTLGYVAMTADQTGITTEVDMSGLTLPLTLPAGRRLKLSLYASVAGLSSGAFVITIRIKEGATMLQTAHVTTPNNTQTALHATAIITPTAGAHTYKGTIQRTVGSSTVEIQTQSGGVDPVAFLLAEDIGAA